MEAAEFERLVLSHLETHTADLAAVRSELADLGEHLDTVQAAVGRLAIEGARRDGADEAAMVIHIPRKLWVALSGVAAGLGTIAALATRLFGA